MEPESFDNFIRIYQSLFEKEHPSPFSAAISLFEANYGQQVDLELFASEFDACVSRKMKKMSTPAEKKKRPNQKQRIAIAMNICKNDPKAE